MVIISRLSEADITNGQFCFLVLPHPPTLLFFSPYFISSHYTTSQDTLT